MLKQITIQADQRGLLFHKGSYVKRLLPGTYRYLSWSQHTVAVLNIAKPFSVEGKDLQLFLQDDELLRELDVVRVQDHEIVLHYEDGQFMQLLKPGVYAYWNLLRKHTFVHTDIRQPELPAGIDRSIISKLTPYVQCCEIASYEQGFLFYDHTLNRELTPGKYYFWKGPVSVLTKTVDLRQQQMDLVGQEMMTEDKVSLRLNFVCQYTIVSPHRVLEMKAFDEQIHPASAPAPGVCRDAEIGRSSETKRGCCHIHSVPYPGEGRGVRGAFPRGGGEGCDSAGGNERHPKHRPARREEGAGEPAYPPGRDGFDAQPAEYGEADGRESDTVPSEGAGIPRENMRQNRLYLCHWRWRPPGAVKLANRQ